MKRVIALMIVSMSLCGCNYTDGSKVVNSNTGEVQRNPEVIKFDEKKSVEKLIRYLDNVSKTPIQKDKKEDEIYQIADNLDKLDKEIPYNNLQYHFYEAKDGYITLYVHVGYDSDTTGHYYYSDTIDIPIE